MTSSGPLRRLHAFSQTPGGVAALSIILFGLVVWTFFPALQGGFLVHDDYSFDNGNPHINTGLKWGNILWAFGDISNGHYLPLTSISYMLDVQLYGVKPWGQHLTNVLIHACNTVLLFLVFRGMTGALWRSLMVAALFGLHPLRLASVAWLTERRDVLSLFFWLLAMWTYARYAEEGKTASGKPKRFYVLTLLFFAAGLMSKVTVVTLPCVFLLLDYWPLKRFTIDDLRLSNLRSLPSFATRHASLFFEKIPFLALAAVDIAVVYVGLTKYAGWTDYIKPAQSDHYGNALVSCVRYLGRFFWPDNLCIYYPYAGPWPMATVAAAGLFLVFVSSVALFQSRRRPYLVVGWLWYLGTLAPMLVLIERALETSGGSQSIADHHVYIPLIGVCVVLVWGLSQALCHWRHAPVALCAAGLTALAACAAVTRHDIGFWKNDVSVWSRAVAVTKDNYVAHENLGFVLFSTDPNQALFHVRESVRINPRYIDGQKYLASVLFVEGKLGEAIAPALEAAELAPRDRIAETQLERIMFGSGQQAQTVSNFLAAVRLDPRDFDHYLDVLLLDTNRADFVNNVAWAFATYPDPKLCNGGFAVRMAKRSCEMTSYRETFYVWTLGAAYARNSQFDEAASTMQQACSLAAATGKPDLLETSRALQTLFRSRQTYHQAIVNSAPPNKS